MINDTGFKKLYFYWLCRGQEEFNWFHGLLQEAAEGPLEGRLEVNVFLTGEIELRQVQQLGCTFNQYFGRPNWGRIFPAIKKEHSGEVVGCFLCGPPAIRQQLQEKATKTTGDGTRFVVYSENF